MPLSEEEIERLRFERHSDKEQRARIYQQLQEIEDAINGIGGEGVQLVPDITTVSAGAGGTVPAGKKYVEFIFSADFTGTVLGDAFVGTTDYSVPFEATGNNTLAAIAYTRTAGSVRIKTLTPP